MHRVIAIMIAGLALAACSSTTEWAGLDFLKPAPILDTVRFESEPPGAEAKTSNGQTCRTPCALPLPTNATIAVTFTLDGYQPDSENIEPVANSNGYPELRPNPLQVELTPLPPPPKTMHKPVAKKKVGAKPAAKPAAKPKVKPKPKPKSPSAQAPAPAAPEPPAQQAPAPWPTTPPPKQ